jgi:hypothetical protein
VTAFDSLQHLGQVNGAVSKKAKSDESGRIYDPLSSDELEGLSRNLCGDFIGGHKEAQRTFTAEQSEPPPLPIKFRRQDTTRHQNPDPKDIVRSDHRGFPLLGCENESQQHCPLISAVSMLINNRILVQSGVRDKQLAPFVRDFSQFELQQSNHLIPRMFWELTRDCDVTSLLLETAGNAGLFDSLTIRAHVNQTCTNSACGQIHSTRDVIFRNLWVSLPPVRTLADACPTLTLIEAAPATFSQTTSGDMKVSLLALTNRELDLASQRTCTECDADLSLYTEDYTLPSLITVRIDKPNPGDNREVTFPASLFVETQSDLIEYEMMSALYRTGEDEVHGHYFSEVFDLAAGLTFRVNDDVVTIADELPADANLLTVIYGKASEAREAPVPRIRPRPVRLPEAPSCRPYDPILPAKGMTLSEYDFGSNTGLDNPISAPAPTSSIHGDGTDDRPDVSRKLAVDLVGENENEQAAADLGTNSKDAESPASERSQQSNSIIGDDEEDDRHSSSLHTDDASGCDSDQDRSPPKQTEADRPIPYLYGEIGYNPIAGSLIVPWSVHLTTEWEMATWKHSTRKHCDNIRAVLLSQKMALRRVNIEKASQCDRRQVAAILGDEIDVGIIRNSYASLMRRHGVKGARAIVLAAVDYFGRNEDSAILQLATSDSPDSNTATIGNLNVRVSQSTSVDPIMESALAQPKPSGSKCDHMPVIRALSQRVLDKMEPSGNGLYVAPTVVSEIKHRPGTSSEESRIPAVKSLHAQVKSPDAAITNNILFVRSRSGLSKRTKEDAASLRKWLYEILPVPLPDSAKLRLHRGGSTGAFFLDFPSADAARLYILLKTAYIRAHEKPAMHLKRWNEISVGLSSTNSVRPSALVPSQVLMKGSRNGWKKTAYPGSSSARNREYVWRKKNVAKDRKELPTDEKEAVQSGAVKTAGAQDDEQEAGQSGAVKTAGAQETSKVTKRARGPSVSQSDAIKGDQTPAWARSAENVQRDVRLQSKPRPHSSQTRPDAVQTDKTPLINANKDAPKSTIPLDSGSTKTMFQDGMRISRTQKREVPYWARPPPVQPGILHPPPSNITQREIPPAALVQTAGHMFHGGMGHFSAHANMLQHAPLLQPAGPVAQYNAPQWVIPTTPYNMAGQWGVMPSIPTEGITPSYQLDMTPSYQLQSGVSWTQDMAQQSVSDHRAGMQRMTQQSMAQQSVSGHRAGIQQMSQLSMAQQSISGHHAGMQQMSQQSMAQQSISGHRAGMQQMSQQNIAQQSISGHRAGMQPSYQLGMTPTYQHMQSDAYWSQDLAQQSNSGHRAGMQQMAQQSVSDHRASMQHMAQQNMAQQSNSGHRAGMQQMPQQSMAQQSVAPSTTAAAPQRRL